MTDRPPTISPDRETGRVLGDPARMQDPARVARNAIEIVIADLTQVQLDFDAKVLELLP